MKSFAPLIILAQQKGWQRWVERLGPAAGPLRIMASVASWSAAAVAKRWEKLPKQREATFSREAHYLLALLTSY